MTFAFLRLSFALPLPFSVVVDDLVIRISTSFEIVKLSCRHLDMVVVASFSFRLSPV